MPKRDGVNICPWSGRNLFVDPALIQTFETYFLYTSVSLYIESVRTFNNYINDQTDPGFHLRSYKALFGEPECSDQDQDIRVIEQ